MKNLISILFIFLTFGAVSQTVMAHGHVTEKGELVEKSTINVDNTFNWDTNDDNSVIYCYVFSEDDVMLDTLKWRITGYEKDNEGERYYVESFHGDEQIIDFLEDNYTKTVIILTLETSNYSVMKGETVNY
jgi:hypothetical protein